MNDTINKKLMTEIPPIGSILYEELDTRQSFYLFLGVDDNPDLSPTFRNLQLRFLAKQFRYYDLEDNCERFFLFTSEEQFYENWLPCHAGQWYILLDKDE